MSFQPSTGHKMKFYRNTATHASPTWVEIDEIGDLSIADLTMGLAELKRRANGFTKNLPSIMQSIAVEFRLHFGLDSATFTVLRSAFFAGTVIEYAIMNDAIADEDSEGLTLPGIIEQFPWDQPLEEVSGHDVRLATGYLVETSTEIDPAWLVVAGA